ncbi:MAG: NADH-quinone oxidoreductase subunit C [bacterium]|nr:NADH-quinone oxidoreductase subunit C [bacterium]
MIVQPHAYTPATTSLEERLAIFMQVLGGLALSGRIENEAAIVHVAPETIREVLTKLRNDERSEMQVLAHMTAVDYSPREPRFDVVYELNSLTHRHRCRVKCALADTGSEEVLPSIPSVTDVYLAANWHERECYDLFGINFEGHPDPRRILLPDRWDGHPLRRDYPFDGKRVWKLGATVVDGVESDVNLGL